MIRARSLSEPKTDQQNQDKRGQTEPRDRDDFDSHFADGRNVVVYIRVAVKEFLSIIFSKVKQKPRVVEEHDSFSAIISAVEAGTGVAVGCEVLGHSFGNRVKFLHITPEPKLISVGIVGTKGRLSPAAETFWQCAKEAASKK